MPWERTINPNLTFAWYKSTERISAARLLTAKANPASPNDGRQLCQQRLLCVLWGRGGRQLDSLLIGCLITYGSPCAFTNYTYTSVFTGPLYGHSRRKPEVSHHTAAEIPLRLHCNSPNTINTSANNRILNVESWSQKLNIPPSCGSSYKGSKTP